MPTYQYLREDGTVFEKFQSFNDPALDTCPDTGLSCRRIVTGGARPIFRGNGWPSKDHGSMDRHMKALAKDPLYTTLSDYKPKVDSFNEETGRAERLSHKKVY